MAQNDGPLHVATSADPRATSARGITILGEGAAGEVVVDSPYGRFAVTIPHGVNEGVTGAGPDARSAARDASARSAEAPPKPRSTQPESKASLIMRGAGTDPRPPPQARVCSQRGHPTGRC